MTVSFKARVPKLSEDDILFDLPFNPKNDPWVWRSKAIRADDIVEIIAISKDMCYVAHYDYTSQEAEYKRTVIKEPFSEAILKWELALTTNVVFDDEEGEDKKEDTPPEEGKEEEDED